MYTIYGKPSCTYCDQAKSLLSKKGIEFNYIDVSVDSELKDKIIGDGFRTVPAIYLDDVRIGGFEDLINRLKNH